MVFQIFVLFLFERIIWSYHRARIVGSWTLKVAFVFIRLGTLIHYRFKMADSVYRVLILGHSYVQHLRNFTRCTEGFHPQLNLDSSVLVQYSGLSGATVSRVKANLEVVEDFEPHLVILLIGTNNLFKDKETPESVATGRCLWRFWLPRYGISLALILTIFMEHYVGHVDKHF